jgi:hypothetical protein
LLTKDQLRGGLLRSLPERLTILRAVDAAEADTFSMVAVQDFNCVAVEDGDDEPVGLIL